MSTFTTSQILPLYDAFLTYVRAQLAGTGVQVVDGPQTEMPAGTDYLLFGTADPLADGPTVAVDVAQQDWAGVTAQSRDETFGIYLTYIAATGTANLADCRARAAANLAVVEQGLRGEAIAPTVTIPPPGWVSFAVTQVQQLQTDSGAELHVQCVIYVQARLGRTG